MVLITQKQFNRLCITEYNRFLNALNKSKHLLHIIKENVGTTIILNTKTGQMGMSRCKKSEEFDITTGTALAWLRYCNGRDYELPVVSKKISWNEVQVGDKLWMYDRGNKYKQYTVLKKYLSHIPYNGFLSVETYDLDLVDDSGDDFRHESGLEHSVSFMKPLRYYKEFWKVLE